MKVFAIDPGNEESAYTISDGYRLIFAQKCDNWQAMGTLRAECASEENLRVVIEMVACYGMPVGREVFETCVWIGRFMEAAEKLGRKVELVYRREEKLCLCADSRAKDANIRKALIDRFAKHDLKNGRGTKKEPDFFYGFHGDMWSAWAVAVTWMDREKEQGGAVAE